MSAINKQYVGSPQVYTSNPIGTTNKSVAKATSKKSKLLGTGKLCKPKPRPIRLVKSE